jgi:hypothetical protein
MLLDLMLNEGGQNDKSIMKQSELEYKKEQDEMLKKAIDESIKDTEKKESTKSKGMDEMDLYSNPIIQSALELGFSLDDAIMAYSLYPNNQDLAMQYLLSTKSYQ